jgi:polar amino acid transport system ATP-binding protein
MVFQSFNLFPHLDVMGNLMVAQQRVKKRSKAEATQVAKEMLARVGLAEKADAFPGHLSGGQQQRVAIARALVTNPPLILADEPTGNLDSATSTEIMKLLTALQKSGMTIVFVTHEPDIAAYAGRKLLLKDGIVVSDERQTQPEMEPA